MDLKIILASLREEISAVRVSENRCDDQDSAGMRLQGFDMGRRLQGDPFAWTKLMPQFVALVECPFPQDEDFVSLEPRSGRRHRRA
jgi:hypothetical protein